MDSFFSCSKISSIALLDFGNQFLLQRDFSVIRSGSGFIFSKIAIEPRVRTQERGSFLLACDLK